ncbi:alpha/beta fold hydrolase [Streptomyces sp. NPDC101234]|uniref:alpha/beta hydrolase n=1 Tax=Streptomyces sp. NPDC101234 TaxID=3366138 RepID=UPI003825AD77
MPITTAAPAPPGVRFWDLPTGSHIAYVHAPATGKARPTPVIFLHGGPGTPGEGVPTGGRELAADGFDVYSYDQLGAGRSTRLRDVTGYTVARQVADLEAIRRTLGADRIILVGQSWGGSLTAQYLAAHAEHVAKAVFTSPRAVGPSIPRLPGRGTLEPPLPRTEGPTRPAEQRTSHHRGESAPPDQPARGARDGRRPRGRPLDARGRPPGKGQHLVPGGCAHHGARQPSGLLQQPDDRQGLRAASRPPAPSAHPARPLPDHARGVRLHQARCDRRVPTHTCRLRVGDRQGSRTLHLRRTARPLHRTAASLPPGRTATDGHRLSPKRAVESQGVSCRPGVERRWRATSRFRNRRPHGRAAGPCDRPCTGQSNPNQLLQQRSRTPTADGT